MNTQRKARLGDREFLMTELPIGIFLKEIDGKYTPVSAQKHAKWPIKKTFKLTEIARPEIVEELAKINIFSPLTIAEMAIRGDDPSVLAKRIGIPEKKVIALFHFAIDRLTEQERKTIEKAVEKFKKFEPGIDPEAIKKIEELKKEGDKPKPMPWSCEEILASSKQDSHEGDNLTSADDPPPTAIDHFSFCGPVRDQVIGTCYAFAAVAEREYYENRYLGNGQKEDLSEQCAIWFDRKGQRRAEMAVGGSSNVTEEMREYGVCSEALWPYMPKRFLPLPAPTRALDNAKYYRNKAETTVWLNGADVNAAKDALVNGHVIAIASNVNTWNSVTGEITMPAPNTPDWENAKSPNHATVIIGYADDGIRPVNAKWQESQVFFYFFSNFL